MSVRASRPGKRIAVAAGGLLVAICAVSSAEDASPPTVLTAPETVDVEAMQRLFELGLPITRLSFSPDGYHYAYLHLAPGGFLRRKPVRCTYLLDLATGENRPIRTPKGRAIRVGGWDSTGRYLLIESIQTGLLTTLTGNWTTYHWIYDVVTAEFVPREPFTGLREGQRFRWKHKHTYHGAWSSEEPGEVWPLFDGELAMLNRRRERELTGEDERRQVLAAKLAVGSDAAPLQVLADVLPRLDNHWTQRGQADPVVSELFGERPGLFVKRGEDWVEIAREVEFVAVLDYGLALITGEGGEQWVLNADRWELLPLPVAPDRYIELLRTRWHRNGGYHDETDPLPRDLQYRRTFDVGQGVGHYYNYVTPDLRTLLILYSFGPEERLLRIVWIPKIWREKREPR
jgi:hypothetical protein